MSETGAAPAAPAAPNGTPPAAAPTNGTQPTAAPATPPPPSKYEVKIAGEAREFSAEQVRKALQMRADEEITPRDLRALQYQVHSQQRWNEASQREKNAMAQLAMLEQDPVAALAPKFGGDKLKARQALIATLGAQLNEEALPPDERERLQRQRELEARSKRLEEIEKREQQSQYDRAVDQQAQQIGSRLAQELTAVGVRPTPKTIADFAAHLMAANQEGRQVTSLAEIAQEVRDEARESARGSLAALEGEALIEYLGEDVVKRVRAHDANRIRRELGQRPPQGQQQTRLPAAPAKPKSTQQVLDELRAQRGGR